MIIVSSLLLSTSLACAAASATTQDGAGTPAPALTPTELSVFNDADFERQFVASYAAETDIEPKLTEPERKVMLEVLKFIQAEKTAEAMALLEKSRTEASSATVDFTIANLHFQAEQFGKAADALSLIHI